MIPAETANTLQVLARAQTYVAYFARTSICCFLFIDDPQKLDKEVGRVELSTSHTLTGYYLQLSRTRVAHCLLVLD